MDHTPRRFQRDDRRVPELVETGNGCHQSDGRRGMNYAIGIDLGGSSIKAVTATPAGEALSRHNIDFDPDRNMEWAEKIRALVQQLQMERGGPAGSIGVSAPGLAAADGRSIAYMPERLQGLEGLDWTNFSAHQKWFPS